MSRRRHYDRPRHGYGRRGRGRYGHGHGYRHTEHHGVRWSTIVIWIMIFIALGNGAISISGK